MKKQMVGANSLVWNWLISELDMAFQWQFSSFSHIKQMYCIRHIANYTVHLVQFLEKWNVTQTMWHNTTFWSLSSGECQFCYFSMYMDLMFTLAKIRLGISWIFQSAIWKCRPVSHVVIMNARISRFASGRLGWLAASCFVDCQCWSHGSS